MKNTNEMELVFRDGKMIKEMSAQEFLDDCKKSINITR